MIFITGDTHIPIDVEKILNYPWHTTIYENDFNDFESIDLCDNYLIVCGDFGLIWSQQESITEKFYKNAFKCLPIKILFIDGNHENHDRLNQYPVCDWHGGKVSFIDEQIIHLKRGQVYEINNKKIFTIGGAYSHDIETRTPYVSWWPNEVPNTNEMNEALNNLAKHNNKVDYIITHDISSNVIPELNPKYDKDNFNDFLEHIDKTVSYEQWFFGHYHQDKIIDKHRCLYNDIIQIM